MFNKILIFGGLALMAILIVENIVSSRSALVFLDSSSTTWMLSFTSSVIWMAIWYGLCNFINSDRSQDDDDLNF